LKIWENALCSSILGKMLLRKRENRWLVLLGKKGKAAALGALATHKKQKQLRWEKEKIALIKEK